MWRGQTSSSVILADDTFLIGATHVFSEVVAISDNLPLPFEIQRHPALPTAIQSTRQEHWRWLFHCSYQPPPLEGTLDPAAPESMFNLSSCKRETEKEKSNRLIKTFGETWSSTLQESNILFHWGAQVAFSQVHGACSCLLWQQEVCTRSYCNPVRSSIYKKSFAIEDRAAMELRITSVSQKRVSILLGAARCVTELKPRWRWSQWLYTKMIAGRQDQ